MTAHLPPSLLALFAPRPPVPFAPPPEKPNPPTYTGLSEYISQFVDPANDPTPPPKHVFETRLQRRDRKKKEMLEKQAAVLAEQSQYYDPHKDPKISGDPYKTIFVARLSFNTSEHKIKKEFEHYGPVKKVRLVTDLQGNSRGYAFVEFEREKDAKAAYKDADGRKVDGKRVLVDSERGRITREWKPRRLGGGKGYTRLGKPEVNQKFSGRDRRDEVGEDARPRDRSRSPDKERSHRPYNRDNKDFHRGGDRGGDRDRGDRGDRERDRGDRDRGDRGGDRGGDRYGQKRERERDRVGSERERYR